MVNDSAPDRVTLQLTRDADGWIMDHSSISLIQRWISKQQNRSRGRDHHHHHHMYVHMRELAMETGRRRVAATETCERRETEG